MADIEIDITSAQQEQPDIDVHPIYGLKGAQGERGLTGNGISSITLASSVGLVDTYTVTYTNGTTTTFTVANGNGVQSIEKTSTDGLVDTYTITFDNGNETTYTVTNGAKGDTGEQGIQGVQGERGDTGATPDITMTASVNNTVGTPSVTVTESGTAEEPVFNLAFSNLKGEQGVSVTGVTLQSTVGLDKTYRMTFSDNTYFDFVVSNGAAGSTEWGGISGVLSNQTDLQTALNNKANISDIPIVNNATLTITQGGSTKGTFSANASTDTTVELDAGALYYAGDGISITPKLATTVSVECSNPNLTVTSSYDDTESATGVVTYEFEYKYGLQDTYTGASQLADSCYYFILNGNLYRYDSSSSSNPIKLVDDSNGNWTFVEGQHSSTGYLYAFGIKNGKLYSLLDNTMQQIGTDNTWTFVTSNYHSTAYPYAYGINNGKLYALTNSSATQIGTDNTWTMLSGNSYQSNNYLLGINNGNLYTIIRTTVNQIDSGNWSMITGSQGSYSATCYGIKEGKLYAISSGGSLTQVGSDTTWTKVLGSSSSSTTYAYGLNNGTLYAIQGTSTTTIESNVSVFDVGNSPTSACWFINKNSSSRLYKASKTSSSSTADYSITDWSYIGALDEYNAIGIRQDALYLVGYSSVTLIGNISKTNGWNLNNNFVDLQDYDLSVTGTPQVNDTIDLTYTTTEVANEYTISATGGA